ADPMDLRYNMINWVHRAQRGWSYGAAVIDPRTGEIIKGNVTLGSLRIRQDVMIAEGLIPQFDELHDKALADLDPMTSPSVMALARIRQLAAHETGHTLGLDHNMAASSYGRASVMDYPSPYVKITDGKLDLSDAYTKSIGSYDKWVIRYAYSQFAPGASEEQELDRIVREAPLFITDPESRPVSAAHPDASVWDSPGNNVAMLRHEIEVRRIALSQFGLRNIPMGTPLAQLEEMLVPLYLHHRYQLEAASKSIGGLDYRYSVKEEGGLVPTPTRRIVPAAAQRDALNVVLSTLDPAFLEIPPRILALIPPRGNVDVTSNTELFEHRTTPAFDPVSAAMASADITLAALLDARRAARLVQYHAEDPANPDFNEVVNDIIATVTKRESGYRGAITRASARLTATRLMNLSANADADPQVRAEASEGLRRLAAKLNDAGVRDEAEVAHRHAMRDDIERFLARPDQPRALPKLPEVPPGPPIGD
ncbi:MAG TPA: zinc-dependent metalloprotease, partial [Thermoanaerobaculia bacterium]|nr:zinc-dependent metalloprotease [Thermoanaerobaculia bacterium]